MELVRAVYELTLRFPHGEKFGRYCQMQKAAVSMSANIAEGATRSGYKEFRCFLFVVRIPLNELETQLMMSEFLGYPENPEDGCIIISELFEKLGGLIRSIQAREES